MARILLSAILTVGLLASGDACAWMCQPGDVAATTAAAPPPCHDAGPASARDDGTSDTPSPAAPSHDGCTGCDLEAAASSTAVEAAPMPPQLAAAIDPTLPAPTVASARDCTRTRAGRVPPDDILSLTSSLRL